MAFKLTWL